MISLNHYNKCILHPCKTATPAVAKIQITVSAVGSTKKFSRYADKNVSIRLK